MTHKRLLILLTMILLPANIWARNPFSSPLPQPEQVAAEAPTIDPFELPQLQGVFLRKQEWHAIIGIRKEKHFVSKNDRFDQFRVLEVTDSSARLRHRFTQEETLLVLPEFLR